MQHTDISSSDSFHITTLRDDFKKLDIVAKYDCDMITLYKCQVNNIDIWLSFENSNENNRKVALPITFIKINIFPLLTKIQDFYEYGFKNRSQG